MFQGLRTAKYRVNDLGRAKEWYAKVLGFPPYFDEPFYVGFNDGGYELGLVPDEGPTPDKTDAGVAYWGVPDIESSIARLLELGATNHEPVLEVGGGIKVAEVRDPFGNIVGIIENPHFKLPA